MADDHMSSMEAMMLSVGRDPWLDPNGGGIAVYDRPLDVELFRRCMRAAVAEVPRLRQRVVAGLGPLSTPRWVPDHEFDLDWHVRRIGAPGDGSMRGLLDYFGAWLQDPYDHTRPLWTYVVVDGLADGRGALMSKVHHAVGDGESLVRMSRAYTSDARNAPEPPDVDLEGIIAGEPEEQGGLLSTALDAIGQGLKWQTDLGRRALRSVTHPGAAVGRAGSEAADLLKTASEQLQPAGSDLWRTRSRRRRLDAFSLDFEQVHAAAHALGGTINDFFLAGAVEAAARYHADFDATPERFHVTVVVNTHAVTDAANAFSPVPLEVSAGPMPLPSRFADVHRLVGAKRAEVHGAGPLAAVASVANLLPTRVMTGLARDQAGHIDFATSNLPGFRGDTFVAGAKTLHVYPFGPVAGTAFNLTMMSNSDALDVGLNIDPVAVAEPDRLVAHLRAAYGDLATAA